MYLIVAQGRFPDSESLVRASIWVNESDARLAQQRALDALRGAGFQLASVDTVTETGPEDYFRPCESKAAYDRALQEGIAWRVQAIES